MICLDFDTASGHSFFVDVVGQRLKVYRESGDLIKHPKWRTYKELRGSGKHGETLEIEYPDGSCDHTDYVTRLEFANK